MAAGIEAHAQHRIAGLEQGEEHGGVGLGAGVGLNVGVGRAKEGLGALDGKALHFVHVLAAAVVALAGIAFRVLVREHAALGLEDPGRGVVFGSNQLDMRFLPSRLGHHGSGQFRVKGSNRCIGHGQGPSARQ